MTAEIRVNPPNEFILTHDKELETKVSITYSTTGKPEINNKAQIFLRDRHSSTIKRGFGFWGFNER